MELFHRIDARGIPYVLIDRRFADANAPYVGADDEEIGRLATSHLIERGCRRIAHIGGPPLTPGAGRLKGYRDTLAAAGLSMADSYVVAARDGMEIDIPYSERELAVGGLRGQQAVGP